MAFDLTLDTVEVAFVSTGTKPTVADFLVAEWVREAPNEKAKPLFSLSTAYRYMHISATVTNTDGTKESDSAYVRVLIGPGGDTSLESGGYDVYGHVIDNPEDIYLKLGTLTIT